MVGSKGRLVHCPEFESGLLKLFKGSEILTNQEMEALEMFKINATSGTSAVHHSNEDEDGGSDIESFTNRILCLADEQK